VAAIPRGLRRDRRTGPGLGLAIGWWLFLIGMLATVFAAIRFVFEYYRGHFAH
jgi:hypothetical protein